MKDILQVCEETENTMTKAISTLLEEMLDVMMWSRTKNILKTVNFFLKHTSESMKKFYIQIIPLAITSTPTPLPLTTIPIPIPPTLTVTATPLPTPILIVIRSVCNNYCPI
jgi:hypothetical protein